MKRGQDGYRYVREERTWPTPVGIITGERAVSKWALYERQDGRAQRVGTALTYDAVREFLSDQGVTNARAAKG